MALVRSRALLVDITRCIGCRECVAACLVEHHLKGDAETVTRLSANALTALEDHGNERYVRKLCRHCLEPSCASVCPVKAFRKTAEGPVVYDASRCLGCRYCMQACPFNVPKYQWHAAVPAVVKCDMCAERLAAGKPTACAEVCPAEATIFGYRDELLAEAERRIAEHPDTYYPHVYGAEEVGGTSVLFLSPVPFEQLGFRTDLGTEALPDLTAAALGRIPAIVSVAGALLLGISWITRRREEVARAEGMAPTAPAPPPSQPKPIEEDRHERV